MIIKMNVIPTENKNCQSLHPGTVLWRPTSFQEPSSRKSETYLISRNRLIFSSKPNFLLNQNNLIFKKCLEKLLPLLSGVIRLGFRTNLKISFFFWATSQDWARIQVTKGNPPDYLD